jgi:hypothetical protein
MKYKGAFLKKILRQNRYIEYVSYFIQNNLFNRLNFSGAGNWEPTPENIYDRFHDISLNYLNYINDNKIVVTKNTLIIELGVGYSTIACYEISKILKCSNVIGYDGFRCLIDSAEKTIIESYFPDIDNVEYIVGIRNLDSRLSELTGKYDKLILFSTSVLQHIWNLDELLRLFDKYSPLGSIHFHTIDFRNLNKFSKQGILYFLKFSDLAWRSIAYNIGHPNRLRYNDYNLLFNKLGYEVQLLKAERFSESDVKYARETYLSKKKEDYDESLNIAIASIMCKKLNP